MYIESSARGLLTIFFRRQAKFFTVFFLVALVGTLYLMQMPRVYQAHSSFLIKPGQAVVPDPSKSDEAQSDSSAAAHNELIQSNIKILESDDVLGTVVKKIGAERLYPGITAQVKGQDSPEHEAIIRLQTKDLKAANDAETSIVDVSVLNKSPDVAKEFTQDLIEAFISRQTQIYSAPQTDFLDKQVTDAQDKLETSQKAFQDFKQKIGISNLDQEVTSLLAEKTALSGFSLQAVTASQQGLTKLESDRAAAMSTYKSDSPIIKRLNDSIAVAKQDVNKRQQDLSAAGGDGSALSPKIAKIDSRMAYLEAHRGEYTQLEDAVQLNQDDYKNYRRQSEEARGTEMLRQQGVTRISIVDNPSSPMKSQPLKRKLLMIAVLLTAVLLGMGTVFLFEMVDERVSYPEQVTHGLGLPVLASFGRAKQ